MTSRQGAWDSIKHVPCYGCGVIVDVAEHEQSEYCGFCHQWYCLECNAYHKEKLLCTLKDGRFVVRRSGTYTFGGMTQVTVPTPVSKSPIDSLVHSALGFMRRLKSRLRRTR